MSDEPSRDRARAVDPRSLDLAIGGQAVIEGVMMRCPRAIATAVRTPSGRIVIRQQPYRSWLVRIGLNRVPLLRGGLHLVESMSLGLGSLTFSAEQSVADEEVGIETARTWKDKLALGGTLVAAFALSLFLFFWMPLVITGWTGVQSGWAFNVIDGILRLAVFLAYVLLIARMPDMRRLFQYHGAEHKTIHVFEAGLPLVPENARRFTTLHPRCGTSFLMFVMLVSVLVFMVLGKPETLGDRLLRLAFVPVIGGISYEFIKLSGKKATASWMKPFVWPGLMLQKITTREPTDDQVEVAMTALRAAMEAEAAEIAERTLLAVTQPAA
jgi:uncharacterized protein YqhQ